MFVTYKLGTFTRSKLALAALGASTASVVELHINQNPATPLSC